MHARPRFLHLAVTLLLAACGAPAGDGADDGGGDAPATEPARDAAPDAQAADASDAPDAAEADVDAGPLECGVLKPGQELDQGQSIDACSDEGFGKMELDMQTDGNFVLYQNDVCRQPTWASGTNGKGGVRAVMETDGNLVVYDANDKALWASNTSGNPGASLSVQGDGNLVIYTTASKAIWSTGTWHEKPKNKLWIAQDSATSNSAIEKYWHIVLEMSLNFTRMETNWTTGRPIEFGGYAVLKTACSVVHSTAATISDDTSTLQCIENQTGWDIGMNDVILYYPQGYGCEDGRNHWNIPVKNGANGYLIEAAFGFTGSGSECQQALGSHEVYEASSQANAADCCNGQDGCVATPSPYGWYTFSACGTAYWAQTVAPDSNDTFNASACAKLQF